MTQRTLEPRGRHIPSFLRTPSTRLGWAAVAGSVGAIAVVVVVNLVSDGSGPPTDSPWWWPVFGISALACLLASGVAGVIAVVRQRERSWMVIAPTALVLLVVVNELIQGVLALVA